MVDSLNNFISFYFQSNSNGADFFKYRTIFFFKCLVHFLIFRACNQPFVNIFFFEMYIFVCVLSVLYEVYFYILMLCVHFLFFVFDVTLRVFVRFFGFFGVFSSTRLLCNFFHCESFF